MNQKQWYQRLKPYAKANNNKATVQLMNTGIPYIMTLLATLYMAKQGVSFIALLPLSMVAAGLMVRLFILFHDCTHHSFVDTGKGNDIIGTILGVLVFTAYEPWRKEHSIHHGNVGNLDRRGVGDIWTMTVEEYKQSKPMKQLIYDLFRHPAFLFTIAPVFLFTVLQRIPKAFHSKKERKSILLTNVSLLIYSVVLSLLFGWQIYLLYQVVIIALASSLGVWLFYVQHQFDDVYWEEDKTWDLIDAALKGSTFYKLPLVLEWVSGYIGYHHIHHLNARIPNYNLKPCYREIPQLQRTKTVHLMESFKLAALKFYDEKSKRLITHREMKALS